MSREFPLGELPYVKGPSAAARDIHAFALYHGEVIVTLTSDRRLYVERKRYPYGVFRERPQCVVGVYVPDSLHQDIFDDLCIREREIRDMDNEIRDDARFMPAKTSRSKRTED